MKFHASRTQRRASRLATATTALVVGLCPVSAWALIVPPVQTSPEQTCPAMAQADYQTATPVAKSEAILGGARSKLDEMRALQAAAAAAPEPQSLAMLSPAAGPSTAVLPCASFGSWQSANFAAPQLAGPEPQNFVARMRYAAVTTMLPRQQLSVGVRLAPVDTSKPNVFGSVALAIGKTPLDSKWQQAQAGGVSLRTGPWGAMLADARRQDMTGKIDQVNRWVNARVSFVNDSARFRVADRWATAAETLRAGQGDCEDYAIAKMKLLEAAGVAREDMFLVIAKDLVRRADHALLVVRNGDRLVVLDNNTDRIVDAASVQDYRPVMSYSAGKAWIHGYATQPAPAERPPIRMAALGG